MAHDPVVTDEPLLQMGTDHGAGRMVADRYLINGG
jgi:hypothetical protein